MESERQYLTRGQQLGEDIRHAKAIYENRWGYQQNARIKDWLDFAKEVKEHLNLNTYQEVTEYLEIKVKRL